MIVKSTTYGRPADSFVRIVDEYQRAGETLIVNRTVTLKPAPQHIVLSFDVGKKPSLWRRILKTIAAAFCGGK